MYVAVRTPPTDTPLTGSAPDDDRRQCKICAVGTFASAAADECRSCANSTASMGASVAQRGAPRCYDCRNRPGHVASEERDREALQGADRQVLNDGSLASTTYANDAHRVLQSTRNAIDELVSFGDNAEESTGRWLLAGSLPM